MSKKNCPKCQGRGWYKGPYCGNLEPQIVEMVCEDCLPHSRPSKFEMAALALAFIVLFTLMIVGMS